MWRRRRALTPSVLWLREGSGIRSVKEGWRSRRVTRVGTLTALLCAVLLSRAWDPGRTSASFAAESQRINLAPATPAPSPTVEPPAPTPTPTPVPRRPIRFRILAVRIEEPSTAPDWALQRPILRQVTTGARVDLAVYVRFQSLPTSAQISTTSFVNVGGRVTWSQGAEDLFRQARSGRFWHHSQFLVHAAGLYTFTAIVTVNGHAAQQSVSFGASTPPPTSRPQSLTFDQLSALSARGTPTVTFSPTERVVIAARWTGLSVSHPASVTVTQTLQSLTTKGWITLGSPQQTIFDAPGGRHQFMFSFVPGSGHPTLRIVVAIALGATMRERSVVIRVR